MLRDEAELLDALAAEPLPDPTDAAPWRAAAPRWPAAPCGSWLRTPSRAGRVGRPTHPPSLAEVDRVLAVAAGEAVATELAGRPPGAALAAAASAVDRRAPPVMSRR